MLKHSVQTTEKVRDLTYLAHLRKMIKKDEA